MKVKRKLPRNLMLRLTFYTLANRADFSITGRMRTSIKTQLIRSLVAALSALGLLAFLLWYTQRPPTMGGDFKLNHNGQAWQFSENAKKLNLLYVGYAKCPDVCPMALSYSAQAFKQLTDKERENVQLIFISVDTENDTAESVSVYAHQFNPEFIGLTGTTAEIDAAIKPFGASYIVEKDPKSYLGYSISHTDRVFVLNKKGIVVDSIQSPRSADEITTKIKENL